MIFSHYTATPLLAIQHLPKQPLAEAAYRRPTGLWLTIDDDWPEWCRRSAWRLERLALRYTVELDPAADLIVLDTDPIVKIFSYRFNALNKGDNIYYLNWPEVRRRSAGVIFSAECFRTATHPDPRLSWVRSWDIRSACVWNAAAIKGFEQDLTYCPEAMPPE